MKGLIVGRCCASIYTGPLMAQHSHPGPLSCLSVWLTSTTMQATAAQSPNWFQTSLHSPPLRCHCCPSSCPSPRAFWVSAPDTRPHTSDCWWYVCKRHGSMRVYHIGDGECVWETGTNSSALVTVQNIYPTIQQIFFLPIVGSEIHTFLVF